MNNYLETSIRSAIGYLGTFEQAVKMAALKDDGEVTKDEEKLIKKLAKATQKYRDELESLLK